MNIQHPTSKPGIWRIRPPGPWRRAPNTEHRTPSTFFLSPVTRHLSPVLPPSTVSTRLPPLALLVIVAGLAYVHGLAGGFIWDDAALIEENWQIRRLLNLPKVFTPAYWADFYGLAYRPIADASFFIDYALWQSNPAGYHLTNLLAHLAVTAFLCFSLVSTLTSRRAAFCAALLFAVHPVHAEALLFVKNRADVFACLFMLLSLLWFAKGQRELRASLHVASVLAFVLALLAKESAALFPLILTAFAVLTGHPTASLARRGRNGPRSLRRSLCRSLRRLTDVVCLSPKRREGVNDKVSDKVNDEVNGVARPCSGESRWQSEILGLDREAKVGWQVVRQTAAFWLIGLAYVVVRSQALGGDVAADTARLDASGRILTAGKTLGCYVLLMLAPVHLSVERAFQFPTSWLEPSALAGLACAVLLAAFILGAFLRPFSASSATLRCMSFAALWFVVTLAPSANVLVLTARPIAEQRAYVPSLGFCLLLGMAFAGPGMVHGSRFAVHGSRTDAPPHSLTRPRAHPLTRSASFILLIIFFAALSAQRVLAVRSDLAMWSDACRKAPSRPQAHLGLANVYLENGRLAEAEAGFRKALRAEPKFWWAHSGLAAIHERRGDLAAAEAEHLEVLSLAPRQYHGHFGLGQVREQQGKPDEAIAFYRRALEMQPKLAHAHGRIGAIHETRGQADEAIAG
ncbi:MAG: tetratricopeptide repeat protein, partial [Planctomycetes bacterium]|nr:tetratricopeptide repeat protein [Planctomycetota bacterium]